MLKPADCAMPNYYRVLGIARTASLPEIKAAYRKLALRYHPDVAGKAGEERFQRLTTAYETLSDRSRKRQYDSDFVHGGGFKRPWSPDDARTAWRENRPQTAYNPAGHAARRQQSKPAVDSQKFNLEEWEAQHYGEEGGGDGGSQNSRSNVRSKSWMDMGGANSHQEFFKSKMKRQRDKQMKNGESSEGGYQGPHKTQRQAAENLARTREARRAAAASNPGGVRRSAKKESCSIS